MPKILNPIHSNAGIMSYYNNRLQKELKEMHASVAYWFYKNYRPIVPEIAHDALFGSIKELFKRFYSDMRKWFRKWDILANWLAPRVINNSQVTTTNSLRDAFIKAGFTVNFNKTKSITTVAQMLIADNVSLIKSIPSIYFSDIQDIVTEGVSRGHDYAYVTKELHRRYAVTKSKASFIARDQIDKANQAIQRTRDAELGITEGIWVHLPGQFTSRQSHMEMDGKRFDLNQGLFDHEVNRWVKPGELILCRCTYRRVIPEFGD